MAVSGKVYVVPIPEEKKWQLVIENTGADTFGITQNILPANEPEKHQHDDHGRYGHGLPVNPGRVSYQKFEMGDMYHNQYPITEECFLRLGIRGHAYMTVKLPRMTDPPLVLDVADFNWYTGSPAAHHNQVRNYPGNKEYRPDADDGAETLERIKELLERAATHGVHCEGKARVVAAKGEGGALSHWEVWFENAGEQPWIGTCSFVRGDKNEGLGFESMAVPDNGSAAMQRIELYGSYGIEAVPHERLRLGVRGYSWAEVELPAEGSVELDLKEFRLDTGKFSADFFEKGAVSEKRREKLGKIQFFDRGNPINDALEPTAWRGAEARARATFDAPSLRLEAVESSWDRPDGGWLLTITSNLPEFDEDGRVGFVAGVKLVAADPTHEAAKILSPKRFAMPGEQKSWFIPPGVDLGGAMAEEGSEVLVATRGMGWFATVRLPGPEGIVDSTEDDDVWSLREDQYNRRCLRPGFVQRVRD